VYKNAMEASLTLIVVALILHIPSEIILADAEFCE
jgi:hypothetical protein